MKIAAYNDAGILGVSDNAEQAMAEAEGFLWDLGQNPEKAIRELKTAPVSDALLDEILRVGFPFDTLHMPFMLGPDGILWCDDGAEFASEDRLLDLEDNEIPF